MRWRPAATISSAAFCALVAACALVGGIDGDYVERALEECGEAECAGVTDCRGGNCATVPCTLFNRPMGSACADGPGDERVCDGEGSCVECNGEDDCSGDLACDQHFCVPLHCLNDDIDPGETDVDCGGPDCAPCANGQGCAAASDCASGFCDGEVCAPCTNSDCQPGFYCDAGVCAQQKDDGDLCNDAAECLSGHCPIQDGVCCDDACTDTCMACREAATNEKNGTCAPVAADTDPFAECAPGAGSCAGENCSGTGPRCEAGAPGTVCRTSTGACDAAESCDGMSSECPADEPQPRYTACNGSGECNSVGECKTARGQSCVADNECSTDVCESDEGVCCAGQCLNQCESCAVSGSEGTCTPVDSGTDPLNECFGGCCDTLFCGTGNCSAGQPCSGNGDCASLMCSTVCQ